MTLQKLQRAPLLHHGVQEAIKDYIVRVGLRPGDALESEGVLAAKLEVSRNSVREAVKGLESVGILETKRGSGIFVREFSFNALLDNLPYGLMRDLRHLKELLDIRQALEEQLIGQAITAMSEDALTNLRQVLQQMAVKAELSQDLSEEDRVFHQVLLAALENETLDKLLDIFWQAFRRASLYVNLGSPDLMTTYRDHAAIVEAVEARDNESAKAALSRHYRGIRTRLIAGESTATE